MNPRDFFFWFQSMETVVRCQPTTLVELKEVVEEWKEVVEEFTNNFSIEKARSKARHV